MCLTGKAKLIHVPDVPKLGRDDPPASVIRAWRVWRLVGSTLQSTYSKTTWANGQPMKTHAPLKPDDGASGIGVHAVKDPRDVHLVGSVDLKAKEAVIGEIVLWGDVLEHDNGYRAEYGYPYRLWTNDFMATSTLRDKYGIAVEIKSVSDFLAEHPKK